MEKYLKDLVREGGVKRLPPGFRFQPTDEELVFEYLRCKAFSLPLPASIIPELNVLQYDPWDLLGENEQERYFFHRKEVNLEGNSKDKMMTTSSGYWKSTGSNRQIKSNSSKKNGIMMMGLMKTLVFLNGRPPHGCRTHWFMHEYCLLINTSQMENWVICRIFVKEGSAKNFAANGPERNTTNAANYSFSSSSSSSPSFYSSGITEVSSSTNTDYEETTGCNFYYY